MASKRSSEKTSLEVLQKKIKAEQKLISDIIEERCPHLNIRDHEIYKFILMFNTILETSFDQENLEKIDSEDGITDTILLVIKAVFNLIKCNIKDLDLPTKIKSNLKKLKNLLALINNNGTNKTSSRDSSRSTQTSDASQT